VDLKGWIKTERNDRGFAALGDLLSFTAWTHPFVEVCVGAVDVSLALLWKWECFECEIRVTDFGKFINSLDEWER
jgi:hypothetical protein